MRRETRESRRGPSLPMTLITLVAMLASGCLGHQYEISRPELERLVRTPPEERGQSIYAVQQFNVTDDPQPAEPWPAPQGEPPPGYGVTPDGYYWVPNVYLNWGEPSCEPPAPLNISASGGGSLPGTHDASAPGGSSGKGSSGGGGGGSGGNINDVGVLLVAAVVVGVAVGVGLAAAEGARYEGTIAVHPHHPVHLWMLSGSQRIAALDELTAEDIKLVERASVMGDEGAGLWERGAAPLNRKGFSYQLGLGNDNLTLPGRVDMRSPGFGFGLGYYPSKKFGLLAHTRIQFSTQQPDLFYNVRLGLEAQWYPLQLWRLHLGPFVGGGQSWSASQGLNVPTTAGSQRPYVSFGGLAEFELSTRLGLTFRWTQDWLPTASADTRNFISSWSVGLAIY